MLFTALFVAEGTSDRPLADLVVDLFFDVGIEVRPTAPDLARMLPDVGHQTDRKIAAAMKVFGGTPDVLVVHRDADESATADTTGPVARRQEVVEAAAARAPGVLLVPVVPVHMTETWLLLDEAMIRQVAGNPRGRGDLDLRTPRTAEDETSSKALLKAALAAASETTGRRHRTAAKRFPQHRHQLLENLDRTGPVNQLPAFQRLVRDVETVAEQPRGLSSL